MDKLVLLILQKTFGDRIIQDEVQYVNDKNIIPYSKSKNDGDIFEDCG